MTVIKRKIKAMRRGYAFVAGAGYGTSKLIDSIYKISNKDPRTIGRFMGIITGIAFVTGVTWAFVERFRKNGEARRYERERRADAELYTLRKMADEQFVQVKSEAGAYGRPNAPESLQVNDDGGETTRRKSWGEAFREQHTMPELPPFLKKVIAGVPAGYESAMLFHLLAMLGAMCFSKVRARYSDGTSHAANLQVVVEGNWGCGKGKFEQIFKALFARTITRSQHKLEEMESDGRPLIVQTIGIGTSAAKYMDIFGQGCHTYIFNSEIRALINELQKGNGLNFDILRKAFENGDVYRNNRTNSKNGFLSVYLNYTFTGTPCDTTSAFKKELEGGTLSRIAWTCIPEQGQYPDILHLPDDLEALKDQIDEWTGKYCFQHDDSGDHVVDEVHIDLQYVCKALDEWNTRQYELAEKEGNPARKDVRLRSAAIAFNAAIVIHMLFDDPGPANWQKRKQVVDLTLFIAEYCVERFLFKFGKEQNILRKANYEAEMVDDGYIQAAPESSALRKENSPLVTDVAELKRLHDRKDSKGIPVYGWDRLAAMSGMTPSTVKRRILEYENNMASRNNNNFNLKNI